MHHRAGQNKVAELLGMAQLVHGHRFKINLGCDRRQRTKLKRGPVVELHINLFHPKYYLAAGRETAAVVAGGAAQDTDGQLGTHIEGHCVQVVVGNGISGGGGTCFPVHTGLTAPGGQGALPGGSGRGHKVGAEAKADTAAGIAGHVVRPLQDGAIRAFHIGEGVDDGDRTRAFRGLLVGSGYAHQARAGGVAVGSGLPAVGRRGHPHLNPGVGPSEVVGFTGLHAGGPTVVGVLELDKPTAPASAKTAAADGEHCPAAGGQALGAEAAHDRSQRTPPRGLRDRHRSQRRIGEQHATRLPCEASYFLVKSRIEGRIGAKRLGGAAFGGVEFDKALLAGEGCIGRAGHAGPGRGHQEEDALLAGY